MRLLCIPLLALIVSAGCMISPEILANQAGYLSGVGYLVVNDPPREEVQKVKSVVLKIDQAVEKLKPGEPLATLYPEIAAEIDAKFTGVTRTLAHSIASLALDGIDVFLLANVDVRDNKDLVIRVARSFTRGATRAFDQFAFDASMKTRLKAVSAATVKARKSAPIRSNQ